MITNKKVVECFLHKIKGNNVNLRSTGRKLYSYSTVIAQWYDSTLICNSTKYSVSTSKHMSYIKNYVDTWTTRNVPRDTEDLIPYLN